jgi:hypothetical protein
MKHLNLTKDQVTRVRVDFHVNVFEAYVKYSSTWLHFASSYTMDELEANAEYNKYVYEWKLPLSVSDLAMRIDMKQLGELYPEPTETPK